MLNQNRQKEKFIFCLKLSHNLYRTEIEKENEEEKSR